MATEHLDGTFDRTETGTRQVWTSGVLAVNLRRDLIPLIRSDDQGRPISLAPWGTFPDLKAESLL